MKIGNKKMKLRNGIKCVVCGAGIPILRNNTNTCDTVCTRARNNKRSRGEQLEWEDKNWRKEGPMDYAGSIPINLEKIKTQEDDEKENLGVW